MECSVVDCNKKQLSRGFCPKHYQRFRKYGDVNVVHRRLPNSQEKRERLKSERPTCSYPGCLTKVRKSQFCQTHIPRTCSQCEKTFQPWPACHKSSTCSNECLMDSKYNKIASRLTTNSTLKTSAVKRYLFRYGLAEKKCKICGLSEWMGKEMPLTLDHINGINNDNRLENVRILCPNCHSQTDTFCGKNKGNGPGSRGIG